MKLNKHDEHLSASILNNNIIDFWPYAWQFYEALSKPFEGKLSIVCDKHLSPECLQQLLNVRVLIKWSNNINQQRQINGIILKVKRLFIEHFSDYYCYELTIMPSISLLKYQCDARIYLNTHSLTIIKEVCQQYGISYPNQQYIEKPSVARPYTVQYYDSDLDFVHRLLHEAGIYYSFVFTDNEHQMILFDSGSGHEEIATDFVVYPEQDVPLNLSDSRLWHWQYNLNKQTKNCYFKTNDLTMIPGARFGISAHPCEMSIGPYWIADIETKIFNFSNDENEAKSDISVRAIPAENNAYPLPIFSRNTALGADNTVVVSNGQKRIYASADLQIKAQFYWDEYNQHNANSSCWLPLKQSWGGENYGNYFIPTQSQEALIAYEHADPEKPLVMGTLANHNNLPPFIPKKYPYRSGYHSQSIVSTSGNYLMFDDDQQYPQVKLQGEKNKRQLIQANKYTKIHSAYQHSIQAGEFNAKTANHFLISSNNTIRIACGASQIMINNQEIIIESPVMRLNAN